MILDERNEFADATALGTSGTGRQLVGDVIDLGRVSQDIGNGEPLYLVVQVDTAVTSDVAPRCHSSSHPMRKLRLQPTALQRFTLSPLPLPKRH